MTNSAHVKVGNGVLVTGVDARGRRQRAVHAPHIVQHLLGSALKEAPAARDKERVTSKDNGIVRASAVNVVRDAAARVAWRGQAPDPRLAKL